MKWISVKDKLPEEDEYVLVYTNLHNANYNYAVAFLYKYNTFDKKIHYQWEGASGWDITLFFEDVTHWMPLPTPPKD